MRHDSGKRAAGYRPTEAIAERMFQRYSDGDLVTRALAGQDGAYAVLLQRYTPVVMGYLVNRLGSTHAAQDLAQETFVSVYRHLGQLREPERFGPWVMRVARTRLLDHLRTDQRRQHLAPESREDAQEVAEGMADPAPGPEDAAAGNELTALVVREIEALPERYRAVVYGRLIGEESTVEIARRLGLRPNTVRQRLARAMRKLRKALESQGIRDAAGSDFGGTDA